LSVWAKSPEAAILTSVPQRRRRRSNDVP